MKLPIARSSAIAIGATIVTLFAAACGLILFPPATAPATIAQHTIDRAASRSSLPFADETTAEGPLPGVYNHETTFSSGSPAPAATPAGPVAIDATQPGNQIHFNGKLVSVAETSSTAESSGPQLAVDIAPVPEAQATNEAAAEARRREEELFRAKWGWELTERVKSAALEDQPTAR